MYIQKQLEMDLEQAEEKEKELKSKINVLTEETKELRVWLY
jgi:hypothetical protein